MRVRTSLRVIPTALLFPILVFLNGCSSARSSAGANTVNFLLESMPTNLDPRIGTDAFSEHVDYLLFDSLLQRDDHLDLAPDLAETWSMPDAQTYIFHLRRGVHFSNGQLLTSADVKFTFDSIISGAIRTPKRGAFQLVDSISAPDPWTVIFRLRAPYASFPLNLIRQAAGVVPHDAGPDFAQHPIGTGPFRFASMTTDEDIVLERNPDYFGGAPTLERVRFRIVPDALVRALELRKGSGDLESNSLTPDMVNALGRDLNLEVARAPGTMLAYISFNCEDPILRHRRVRQALAYATDRDTLIRYLIRGLARPAESILPPNHWAYDGNVTHYDYDPARANALLDAAGLPRGPDGIRFHLEMKTSTDESTRILAAALQDQWRHIGVQLDLRSLEFATFYADITRGSFQLYTLRWVGANLDPDVFEYVFGSDKFPPEGANRGHYHNPQLDVLLGVARVTTDRAKRKAILDQIQQIVADDEPYINLWFYDNICVHRRRLTNIQLSPGGDFDFLEHAILP
ncbi:MAG TPA: ABC transporter substrate-binding protein [Candidatus Acidoferrales bacterium]|nr:ABC transporter substrate-binding protein [Candidatus Acidoferrales bacterium]